VNKLTNEVVAIKIMNKKKIRKQAGLVELVRQEVAHMKLMPVHDHLITLLEVLESDTHIYLVMECAAHGELYQRILADGACTHEQARIYWRQLLSGLEYVHSQKICHRDLKLENLLLDPNDVLKISDFGLSVLRREYQNQRELIAIAGTPNYIAPEIIAGRGYDGFMADIWSAGVCLYGMLAGYLPFNTGKDVKKLFKIISRGDVTYPDRFDDDVVDLLTGIFKTNPSERSTLQDCLAHPWTNEGHAIDLSEFRRKERIFHYDISDLSDAIVQYSHSQMELAEAVKEIKSPSPDIDDDGIIYSPESPDPYPDEDDLDDDEDLGAPRLEPVPQMEPMRSRECRLSPGKSVSEASTHPSNGDLSNELKHIPSLSHEDIYDMDSDAECLDLSTDFTDSEDESESSHSGSNTGPAIQNAFTLLSIVQNSAFTSLLSNPDSKSKSVQSVVTCFHSKLQAEPLLDLCAATCRSMDYVRMKVIAARFLIKLRVSQPHQKNIRVNIEIKEANGDCMVVECHRLKGMVGNYQDWYEEFERKFHRQKKLYAQKNYKKYRLKEEVTPPRI